MTVVNVGFGSLVLSNVVLYTLADSWDRYMLGWFLQQANVPPRKSNLVHVVENG